MSARRRRGFTLLEVMVALAVMIGSFRETVSYWVDETMVADIYARPLTRSSATDEGEISGEAVTLAKADPQVAAVYPFTTQPLNYQNEPIVVGAGDFDTFLNHGRLLFKAPVDARDQIRAAIGSDLVTVNESFSLRFKKRVGDVIEPERVTELVLRGPQYVPIWISVGISV